MPLWVHPIVPWHSLALSAAVAAFRATRSPFQWRTDVHPSPASIRIPISGRDPQRPYGLIRPHNVYPEPIRLCRLFRVRDIPIPAFRSPELSGAPGVTSGLQVILLLDGGISRP